MTEQIPSQKQQQEKSNFFKEHLKKITFGLAMLVATLGFNLEKVNAAELQKNPKIESFPKTEQVAFNPAVADFFDSHGGKTPGEGVDNSIPPTDSYYNPTPGLDGTVPADEVDVNMIFQDSFPPKSGPGDVYNNSRDTKNKLLNRIRLQNLRQVGSGEAGVRVDLIRF